MRVLRNDSNGGGESVGERGNEPEGQGSRLASQGARRGKSQLARLPFYV